MDGKGLGQVWRGSVWGSPRPRAATALPGGRTVLRGSVVPGKGMRVLLGCGKDVLQAPTAMRCEGERERRWGMTMRWGGCLVGCCARLVADMSQVSTRPVSSAFSC